ncbi:bifunctional demethylmenaquinone methyltransferase/2-methoxy-6-polyprenyl-1,4-benzoquinol methylase UbiE [Coralloluteibacterium stylophorae]|uniref:Ubiquinone/menaquinone biosynthesis C-methyltransferase UbiE n=1 Tax=Coralloluteibacterium stylophorae TaxID=1776034 RepID=A0A8J8AZ12_9GAMM|nr:bifunctional demethylmenaquinone methyltransferase/2-methoxy-6-polyprenyl-1,4-benzoquinol methylase UbiE [Coralloluteibacterium stylophorae]MBS7458803.1 bifunctional demethylmenaquinone methyltransferase/2-methoxy-6-polyprenyl-1,4-benzoquinol methylase UbiE [Coralloluteibacterium stylophorae]
MSEHDSRPDALPVTVPAESAGDTTHFGYRDVPTREKQKLVGEVFSSVARRYDVMNDLMSFGIHRVWKRYFVATSGVKRGDRVLDLAGGTGDIAALLHPRVGEGGGIVVGDINAAMLGVGRDRLTDRGLVRGLDWVQCNAEALPFPDKSFDLVTIAFGLRNVTDKARALADMHRVLKVGGRVLVLEFSQVRPKWFRPLYDIHSFQVLPRLGTLIAGDRASYQYLAESIRKHPPQAELQRMLTEAGFARASHRNLSAGIVAIHSGYRV